MKRDQVEELLLQALETELGGVDVYTTAVGCAVNDELRREWNDYLAQTRNHVEIVKNVFDKLGLDPDEQTPGRQIVRHVGESLVKAMKMARAAGDSAAAQVVAAECVVLAETKDHLNWELLGAVAERSAGRNKEVLQAACAEVEEEEDEHLYHTTGWCRELWIQSLGMPAVLPPPEEEREVKTAIGAARAKQSREEML